jgi:hypothetical protein
MEAKDTVMNDATKRQFIYVKNKPDSNLRGFLEEDALLCQAEISFKAGYSEGLGDGQSVIMESGSTKEFGLAYKAGQKAERERIRQMVMDKYNGAYPAGYCNAIIEIWNALKGETNE